MWKVTQNASLSIELDIVAGAPVCNILDKRFTNKHALYTNKHTNKLHTYKDKNTQFNHVILSCVRAHAQV